MDNSAHLAQHPRHKLHSDTHVLHTIHEPGVGNDYCSRKAVRQLTPLQIGFSSLDRSSLAGDERRNMVTSGGHSNLGKMKSDRPFTQLSIL